MPTKSIEVPDNDELLAEAGVDIPEPFDDDVADGPARPNVTTAQYIALVPVIATLLHAFGVFELSGAQQEALSEALKALVAIVGADAALRIGRNLSSK
jgi:hypothetical protein